ncbi:MAG TPA: hypothetical protein P5511_04375 [Candidatus Goldiibacteriota bacterium]|nr:hypothetical protein [Candidatus Goldiibacteriota bacterium]
MSTTEVGEKVKAGVVFERGEAVPQWFVWKKRKIDVKQVSFTWRTAEGDSVLVHYSVVSEGGLYELSYNLKTLEWMLENTAE